MPKARKRMRLPMNAEQRHALGAVRRATAEAKGTGDYAQVRAALHDWLMAGMDKPNSENT